VSLGCFGGVRRSGQFKVLGEKVALIAYTATLKEEDARLVEELHMEEEKTG